MTVLGVVGLALALLGFAPNPDATLRTRTPQVDASLVERGLRARVGEALGGWSIDVDAGDTADTVWATLQRPDGTRARRSIEVSGETVDDRSRELAAALAIMVDHWEPRPELDGRTDVPAPPRERYGYLALGPRIGLGGPPDPDFGGTLSGGAWLVNDHLQPRLQASYSVSARGELLLHGVRFGGGLAAGGSVARRRLWLGALVVPQAHWVQARDVRVVHTWTFALELSAQVQLRWPRALLGLRTGSDLSLPPIDAQGATDRIRWRMFRYMAALDAGVRF